MNPTTQNVIESTLRWLHVVSGVLWVGLLWFLNFVHASYAKSLDEDLRRRVTPLLLPRVLRWFRWGAAATWITGVLLLGLVYYHGKITLAAGERWGGLGIAMVVLAFLGVLLYDVLARSVLRGGIAAALVGILLVGAFLTGMKLGGFSFRGYTIHLGTAFGTIMAFNVWFRIWPAQRRVLAAMGAAPDPSDAATAALRSRHNTYLSVPLLFLMIGQHATWAASRDHPVPVFTLGIVAIGWALVFHLYLVARR